VCAQTYRDVEIILVDDGSTDGSGGLCDELAQTDTRIRVIHQPNQGASAARNAGLDCATGQYIQFLDGDDLLEPTATEVLLQTLVKDNAEMVICGHRRINYRSDGVIIADLPQKAGASGTFNRKTFLERFSQCDYLVYVGWVYCWDRLLSKAFLDRYALRFPVGMTVCEDRMFDLQCFAVCHSVSVIPDCLCRHFVCVSYKSACSASIRADESRWAAHQESFDRLYALLSQNGCLNEAIKRSIGQDYFNTMVVAIYRLCRSDTATTFFEKLRLIRKICQHPMMRDALRTYSPRSARESRMMPRLMRLGNGYCVTLFALWKARRIYG